MKCPKCKSTFKDRTVCPECRVALRPKTLTIVAVVYFIFGGLAVISGIIDGSLSDIVGGLINIIIAWFLLKMNAFAIGFAMLRAFAGIVIPVIALMSWVISGFQESITLVGNVFGLLAYLISVILIFLPSSREAFRLTRVPMRELDRIAARESAPEKKDS